MCDKGHWHLYVKKPRRRRTDGRTFCEGIGGRDLIPCAGRPKIPGSLIVKRCCLGEYNIYYVYHRDKGRLHTHEYNLWSIMSATC